MISNSEREFITQYLMTPFDVRRKDTDLDSTKLYITSVGPKERYYDDYWDAFYRSKSWEKYRYLDFYSRFQEQEVDDWIERDPVEEFVDVRRYQNGRSAKFYTFDEIGETQYIAYPSISFDEAMGFSDDGAD